MNRDEAIRAHIQERGIPCDVTIGKTPLKAGTSWGLLTTAINAYNQYAAHDAATIKSLTADLAAMTAERDAAAIPTNVIDLVDHMRKCFDSGGGYKFSHSVSMFLRAWEEWRGPVSLNKGGDLGAQDLPG